MIKWSGPRLPTQSLFFEMTYDKPRDPDVCLFTLKEDDIERDGKTYLSLKKLYVEREDLTEYEFAKEVFGSFPIWENLCGVSWFIPHVEQWRKELQLKIKAETLTRMVSNMREKSKDLNFSASKYLAEFSIAPMTKAEKKAEKKRVADHVSEDMKRLGLKVVRNND